SHRKRPIHRALPRSRTRTCRRYRGEWCAEPSSAPPVAAGFEPGWGGQRLQERVALGFLRTAPLNQEVAVLGNGRGGTLIDDQPLQVMASDGIEAERLPGVDIQHQMPGKTFEEAVGIELQETLILQS